MEQKVRERMMKFSDIKHEVLSILSIFNGPTNEISQQEKTQKVFIYVNQEQQNKNIGKQSLFEHKNYVSNIKKIWQTLVTRSDNHKKRFS